MQKEQVDIGVGKKPAAAEAAGGDQSEILWSSGWEASGLEDDFIPEPLKDRIDQRGAPGDSARPSPVTENSCWIAADSLAYRSRNSLLTVATVVISLTPSPQHSHECNLTPESR